MSKVRKISKRHWLFAGVVAAALAVGEGTVKSRINRAKARLKEILSGGGNLSAAASVKTAGEEGQR